MLWCRHSSPHQIDSQDRLCVDFEEKGANTPRIWQEGYIYVLFLSIGRYMATLVLGDSIDFKKTSSLMIQRGFVLLYLRTFILLILRFRWTRKWPSRYVGNPTLKCDLHMVPVGQKKRYPHWICLDIWRRCVDFMFLWRITERNRHMVRNGMDPSSME